MRTLSAVLLLAACLAAIGTALAKPTCPTSAQQQWLDDPDDCSVFYMCHDGRLFHFNCGDNAWDPNTKTCVSKGSTLDKCTAAKELQDLIVPGTEPSSCDNSQTAVFAKADNCAQYYDCSSNEVTVDKDPHVVECPHPLVFDTETKRCLHYSHVQCGLRKEPLDECDYVVNQCMGRPHCVPCSVRFPSCRGMEDGLGPWVGREFSPFFVLCEKERVLYRGQCQGSQIFHPVDRICTDRKPDNL